jgi:hypothetical protein
MPACSPLPSRGGEQVNDSLTTRKDVTPRMAGKLGPLSPGELSTTTTACDWLVNRAGPLGLLEPVTIAKISSLLADCRDEAETRVNAELAAHRAAQAGNSP